MRPPQSFKLTTSKRSNSTRLPQGLNVATSKTKQLCEFLHLTTSKTKQFCETSSFFEVDTIKNETILRDLQYFKNGNLSAELTASYQCILRFVHSTCLKYCTCHEKVMPGHTKCCTCHAKSSWQTKVEKRLHGLFFFGSCALS